MKTVAPTTRDAALESERYAERADDPDAWLVAADAWEEAGEPTYAWYARLRAANLPRQPIITRQLAENIRDRERRIEEARERWDPIRFAHGGGYAPDEMASIRQMAGVDREVANAERSALEVFHVMTEQPERIFGYDAGDAIRTFMGDVLGTVVHRGGRQRVGGAGGGSSGQRRPGRSGGALIEHVIVRAVNGYEYRGTCNLETGTYCRLRRGKAWFRGF